MQSKVSPTTEQPTLVQSDTFFGLVGQVPSSVLQVLASEFHLHPVAFLQSVAFLLFGQLSVQVKEPKLQGPVQSLSAVAV